MLVRLAVDLGTTHTVAVVRRANQQPRALLFDGSPMLPSAVFVDPAKPGDGAGGRGHGAVHTGRDAQRLGGVEPHRFEPHPKRRIDEGTVLLGTAEVSVVSLLAAILRRVAGEARQAGVDPVGGTALTCPADWGGPRRELLRQAAREAGLGQVLLIDEPVAAATYCVDVLGQQVPVGAALAVFDFGGGTLDVAVVRREPAGWRVLGTGGLDDLGGLDVDAALVGHLGRLVAVHEPEAWRRLSAPEGTGELRARLAFWSEVRGAKEMLSRTSSAPVSVPGRDEPLHLTREELDAVAGPLVARAVDETRRVLERAGTRIVALLLVGGTSRMPLVASRLHARLGVAPAVPEQPELPVAYGGLLAGSLLTGPPAGPGSPVGVAGSPGGVSGFPVAAPGSPAASAVSPSLSGSPLSGPPGSGAPAAGPSGYPPPSGYAPGPVAAPPRPVKRRRTGRAMVAVLLVVTAILTGGWYGVRWIGSALGKVANGNLDGLGAGSGIGADDPGANLKLRKELALPAGDRPVAVAATGERAFVAWSVEQRTEVAAIKADGTQVWQKSVPIEPAELKLTVVGDLLLVDADRAATSNGKDVRAVLATGDGTVRWQAEWENYADVVYLGTDAVVAVTRFQNAALQRIDLKTGPAKPKWVKERKTNVPSWADHWSNAVLSWPQAGAKGTGTVPAVDGTMRDDLAAGPDVIELDESGKKVFVIDGATGRQKATGPVPLDYEYWMAFGGYVFGQLTSVSGADVVAAYTLPGLKEAWQYRLPAGANLERLKPCGAQLVCLVSSSSGADTMIALTATTGKAAWEIRMGSSDKPGWYVAGDRLLAGTGSFSTVGQARGLGQDGKLLWGKDDGKPGTPDAVAAGGGRMLLRHVRTVNLKDTMWRLVLAESVTGKVIGGVDVGKELPQEFAHAGDVVVVITSDRQARVLTVG